MTTDDAPPLHGAAADPGTRMIRAFTWRSAFGVAFAFISPIVALYGIFALTFAAAGPSSWWAFFLVLLAQLLVAMVFGELASKWPYAGSVYQWSRRLAGETYGWFCGWTYTWTVMIAIGSAAFIAVGFLPVVLGTDPFTTTTQLLVTFGFIALGTGINLLGHAGLKALAVIAVVVELVGSVGLGAWLLLFHREQPFSVLFQTGGAGYGSGPYLWSGLAAAMAFVGWAFVGFESAGAIAEEVHEPRRAVPKAMLISLAAVGSVVLFSALGLILAIPDIGAVLSGATADPVAETIALHLGDGVTRPLFAMFVLAFLATFVTAQAAASRVIWSFARDDVLPGSGWLKQLTPGARIPARALVVTAVVPCVVVLTSLEGAVYSTMVLFSIAGFYIAFAFPLVAASRARLRGAWQPGVWNAGKLAAPVTYAATVWILFQLVNIVWPRDTTSPWYIQWASLIMVVALGLLGMVAWWSRRAQITAAEREIEADPETAAADATT